MNSPNPYLDPSKRKRKGRERREGKRLYALTEDGQRRHLSIPKPRSGRKTKRARGMPEEMYQKRPSSTKAGNSRKKSIAKKTQVIENENRAEGARMSRLTDFISEGSPSRKASRVG